MKLLYLCFIFSLILGCCITPEDSKLISVVTESTRLLNPYSEGQQIQMINQNGQTVKIKVIEREIEAFSYRCLDEPCMNCVEQTEMTLLESPIDSLNFKIAHGGIFHRFIRENATVKTGVLLTLNDTTAALVEYEINHRVDQIKVNQPIDTSKSVIIDSLLVNDKWYDNVVKSQFFINDRLQTNDFLFYNRSSGVLILEWDSGDTWELID